MLTDLDVARELKAVDAPKSNGGVERRITLVLKGAKSAWLEVPRHLPGVEFPARVL